MPLQEAICPTRPPSQKRCTPAASPAQADEPDYAGRHKVPDAASEPTHLGGLQGPQALGPGDASRHGPAALGSAAQGLQAHRGCL